MKICFSLGNITEVSNPKSGLSSGVGVAIRNFGELIPASICSELSLKLCYALAPGPDAQTTSWMSTPAQHPIQPMDDTTASPALPSPSSNTSQDPVHSPFSFNTNTLPHSFLSGRTGRSGKSPSHRLSILGKIPKDVRTMMPRVIHHRV